MSDYSWMSVGNQGYNKYPKGTVGPGSKEVLDKAAKNSISLNNNYMLQCKQKLSINNAPSTSSSIKSPAFRAVTVNNNAVLGTTALATTLASTILLKAQEQEIVENRTPKKAFYKNIIINPQKRADIDYVKNNLGLEINVLKNGKVNIGGKIFDDKQGHDKGGVAKIVKIVNANKKFRFSDLPKGVNSDDLAKSYYENKVKEDYQNEMIKELPNQLKDDISAWFDKNFKPVAHLGDAEFSHFLYANDDFTHSNAITYADYDAKGVVNFRPNFAVKLDILGKNGYSIKLHGEDGRNASYLKDIEITTPNGEVVHCPIFFGNVNGAIDEILQNIADNK